MVQERHHSLRCEGCVDPWVNQRCWFGFFFIKTHRETRWPIQSGQVPGLLKIEKLLKLCVWGKAILFNYLSVFVVLMRTSGMECSPLLHPDMLTLLIQTSSAGTKQEENTDCIGYLLKPWQNFWSERGTCNSEELSRADYLFNTWRRKVQVAHLCSKSQKRTQLPEELEFTHSHVHHLPLELFCFV